MGLESASFISDLVATNPVTGDGVNAGDDHLRLTKAVLQATFPGATASLRQNFIHIASSVSGTNTVTANSLPAIAAYTYPTVIVLTPANTNTGATTLNVNGLGALDVFNIDGTACTGGELLAGVPAILVLDSGADDWIIVNPNPQRAPREWKKNTQTGSYTFVASDYHKIVQYFGTGVHTFTAPASVLLPDDVVRVWNVGSNSITLAATSGLYWLSGAAVVGPASRTLAQGGAAEMTYSPGVGVIVVGTGIS